MSNLSEIEDLLFFVSVIRPGVSVCDVVRDHTTFDSTALGYVLMLKSAPMMLVRQLHLITDIQCTASHCSDFQSARIRWLVFSMLDFDFLYARFDN